MPEASGIRRRGSRRFTRNSVKVKDFIARYAITLVGIGTIASILAVCVFLFWVALPLFKAARPSAIRTVAMKWEPSTPVRVALNENELVGWALEPNGSLLVFRTTDGNVISNQPLTVDSSVTAWMPKSPGSDDFAIGLADGSIRLGQLRFVSELLSPAEAQHAIDSRSGDILTTFPHAGGLAEQLSATRIQLHKVELTLATRVETDTSSPVRLLDYATTVRGTQLAVLTDDGKLQVIPLRKRSTLLGSDDAVQQSGYAIPISAIHPEKPSFLIISGSNLYVAWSNGTLARYDLQKAANPVLAETLNLLSDSGAKLTALAPLAGRGTLISGDSHGHVKSWFLTKPEGSHSPDLARLTRARQLPRHPSEVTAIVASDRSRIVATGHADGHVQILHASTGQRLIDVPIEQQVPIQSLAIGPKQNALIAATTNGIGLASMELNHPEATFANLFMPVWYQDYEAPAHVWQSSGGSESNEPKFGVVPLVFGTLKATLYSLLFGVPIALLAAIYTSEFLARGARARIKPTIEFMASLPSVVLGYLAAFVIAPAVARHVPMVLLSFLTLPFAFLLAAYLIQLLPEALLLRTKYYRFLLICLVLPLGFGLALMTGPLIEQWFFDGNILQWLDTGRGSPLGGWLIFFLPLTAIVVGYLVAQEITPRLRRISAPWSQARCAVLDLLKFTLGTAGCIAIALALSALVSSLGYDARQLYLGSYVQRNAMIVGFAMGFAIIPIIYTIAEDALASVPEHLRSASLGAGATPWQTTVRIIIPTAMSGLFSAVMIGLGRAVGETMIVLMAAGNTPIMDWNIFNGFRTLSANLAVELPEAEQGSTHFRILFLTALVLFCMTFVVNTVAEWVRQRFRRRAFQL